MCVNIDALADAPEGFDWVELTIRDRPTLQLIWPEHLTDTVLTALRSTMMNPAVAPLPTPGRVHDPILDRATATSILDLREKSEKRGRLVALSALSAAVLVAGGALAWTMLDDDPGPDTKVSVAGITQEQHDHDRGVHHRARRRGRRGTRRSAGPGHRQRQRLNRRAGRAVPPPGLSPGRAGRGTPTGRAGPG